MMFFLKMEKTLFSLVKIARLQLIFYRKLHPQRKKMTQVSTPARGERQPAPVSSKSN